MLKFGPFPNLRSSNLFNSIIVNNLLKDLEELGICLFVFEDISGNLGRFDDLIEVIVE